jgi:hypothetical protein
MAGAGIADCLDGTLHTVLGRGFYHQPAAQPDAMDGHLINIAEGLDVPGELSVFVRQDAARDEGLRSYAARRSGPAPPRVPACPRAPRRSPRP